jgi:serine/threonine protein kinase
MALRERGTVYCRDDMGGNRTDQHVPAANAGSENPDERSGVQAPAVEWEDATLIEPDARSILPQSGESIHPLSPLYPAVATFGRYEILGRLAVGGMAEVFLARELGHHHAIRHVAIKRILPQIADDETFVEMFLDEARLAVQLNHPNICHIYDFGELEEAYFIAMEWVNGVSLGKMIKRARDQRIEIPVPVAIKITAHIAEALHYAHQARDGMGRPMTIVHRDVSPQNIMVRFDGVVKLLDFGIAKNASQTSQTEAGVVKGKFSYMAPEQCLGRTLDGRTDIFALGSCIYEALTGTAAFRRGSDLDTMRAIVHEEPKPIRVARPDVPEALGDIVDRALAKDPKDRFQTAGDLYVALERWLAERSEFIRAMHISQYVEKLMPGEAQQGPLTQSSPSVRSLQDPLGTLSPPKQSPAKGAKIPDSTVDVHISVLGDEQPAKTSPRDGRSSPPPPGRDTGPMTMADEGPTEQLGPEQLEAVLGNVLREPVGRHWLDDDQTTSEVPGGAVMQPEPAPMPAPKPAALKPALIGMPMPLSHPSQPLSPRNDPPHISIAGAPRPMTAQPLLPHFDETADAPTTIQSAESPSTQVLSTADMPPLAAVTASPSAAPKPRAPKRGRALPIVFAIAAVLLIGAIAVVGVWVGLHPEALDGVLASEGPVPVANDPPPSVEESGRAARPTGAQNNAVAEENAGANPEAETGVADGPEAEANMPVARADEPAPPTPEVPSEPPAEVLPETPTAEAVAPEPPPEAEVPAPATPPTAGPSALLVRSTPAGARVRLNNRLGTTPFTFEALRPGMYTLTVVKPGFEPLRQRVRVAADQGVVEIAVELRRLPAAVEPQGTGVLYVTTNEPATVYVGGRLLGRTPVRESVPAGTARLRLVDGEGVSHIRSVQVREDQVTPVYLVLGQ